ncbi:hypothetical protein RJ639_031695 [Escallonia herrerae]|uniref:Uncharacterized protein n=1 Tax=Escallonia herrerae TaxID=1293975 RepID=A0AA88WZ01_9ASTE|nr:hypothetical protein RJ639_031695 [Escallonia herrerae]
MGVAEAVEHQGLLSDLRRNRLYAAPSVVKCLTRTKKRGIGNRRMRQCIFRVPNKLSKSKESARPRAVSIGPLHKRLVLPSAEQRILTKCYPGSLNNINMLEFAELMLVDGCFVLDFCSAYPGAQDRKMARSDGTWSLAQEGFLENNIDASEDASIVFDNIYRQIILGEFLNTYAQGSDVGRGTFCSALMMERKNHDFKNYT